MEAIEFKATIKDGIIQIPKKYKQRLKDKVKVIILCNHKKKRKNIIEKMWGKPMIIGTFSPLSRDEIYEG